MSENKTSNPISEETAREQVLELFAEFEADHHDDDPENDGEELASFKRLVKAVEKGRLEISTDGGDLKIRQILKRPVAGMSELEWNWNRLGMGKAKIKIGTEGMGPYDQQQKVAQPMIGIELAQIRTMHPIDLGLVEVIAQFFINI